MCVCVCVCVCIYIYIYIYINCVKKNISNADSKSLAKKIA